MKTEKHWRDIFRYALNESDLVLEVLDIRNPLGTRNLQIEKFLKEHYPKLELVLLLNKSDMIPKKIVNKWKAYFRNLPESPKFFIIAAKHHKGLEMLEGYLREQSKSRQMNVLIIGYPNTGKSTLIQALTRNRKKLGISPHAGFTRGIKKIKLTNNLYLLDTPGIIPFDESNETEMALKACMVADKLEDPLAVVEAIFQILSPKKIAQHYNVSYNKDDTIQSIVEKIGKAKGRLITGGKANVQEVYKMVIRDWQRNRLKFYILPPGKSDQGTTSPINFVRYKNSSIDSSNKRNPYYNNTKIEKKQFSNDPSDDGQMKKLNRPGIPPPSLKRRKKK